ncbi:MAG: GNAT family N-acetyltransferase [Bacteroidetes bacterium]|nr:GNAT family N-acetyltransferase [Bacteroidota bacterium]
MINTAITIRPISTADNAPLAAIIRSALKEFNAAKPGTVYFDPTTDNLYSLFKTPGSMYFVIEEGGVLLGGAGIFPTENLPAGVCELVKLYLHPAARGKGFGKLLMQQCFDAAKSNSYNSIYLETMPELKIAVPLYEKMGFHYLPGPLGNSGHHGCDIWMLKELE